MHPRSTNRPSQAHPAPFPIELPRRLISMFSYAGPDAQTVLDPFAGRFTTTIAAMLTGRNSVANELVPEYFASGLERVRSEAARLMVRRPMLVPADHL